MTAKPKLILYTLIIILCLLLIITCTKKNIEPELPEGEAQLIMSLTPAFDNGFEVDSVYAKITKEDIVKEMSLTIIDTIASGTFKYLEPGTWTVEIKIYNDGILIAQGFGEGEVIAGQTTILYITVEFVVGNLIIIVDWGFEEPEDIIPPSKVHLIPHLCDPGDPGCTYTDKNNGIDPVQSGNPDYNWMKIQWDGTDLVMDGDIHHIDVYRYNNEDTTKVMVDRIDYHPDSTKYIDKFISYEGEVIQRTWSYYIIPYDEADNFTNSDTVSYKLIDKPGLQSPDDNYECSVTDSITFSWFGPSNYSYRILFFDLSHNLQFAKDLIPGETECNIPEILENSAFSPIPWQTYIWRIDAFDGVGGSESEERRITFFSNY